MSIEEIAEAVEGHKIIRHRGQVFFTSYDRDEAERFSELGAFVQEIDYTMIFWEIHPAPLLDEVDDDGDPVNQIEVLRDFFRERDGYSPNSIHEKRAA